ncbi:hypothetical protein [Streptomyces venezuelae]|uniref:Cytotoxic translational repressor of toxin-antitoxin stability system n=1 Tax=Streptomyces venezuelae TaxID=54571 RepID=A0A5P2B6H6_STRVZ|nr:hypothetical protein [Streptomyces venezuelae]QES25866.1 hypothetical protein DEJ47_04815 [Streptomyces venezuelae]
MTYELIVPPSIQRQIAGFPVGDQAELIAFFDRLPDECEQITEPRGLEVPDSPVRMRIKGLSRLVVTVLLNDTTITVTVIEITEPHGD